MRDITRSFASGRRITGLALAAFTTVAAVAALAPSAMAAGSVTITTAFENSPISTSTSDAVGYAFKNSTGASETVTFTDGLPAGVTLDNPVGITNYSGSGACTLVASNASPGASSVTLTVTVPSATGTVCTVSFSIVATVPSADAAISDAYSGVSAQPAATVTPAAGALTVLSSPSLSFTAPSGGQSFSLGQVAEAVFACNATDPKDSIDSFFGTDDEGNQIESGAPIDTVDPGSHTLEVDCYSAAGGGEVAQTINYTVGSYTLSAVKAAKTTDLMTFATTVPAGKLVAKDFYGKKVIGTTTVSPTSPGRISVAIKPTKAGKRLLAGLRGGFASLKLQVSFTPQAIGTGDQQITAAAATVLSRTVKLPLTHPAKKTKTKKTKKRKTAKKQRAGKAKNAHS